MVVAVPLVPATRGLIGPKEPEGRCSGLEVLDLWVWGGLWVWGSF